MSKCGCAPYLARQMWHAKTRTPGMWGTTYLFGRMGAKHLEPGSWDETQTHQRFTQVQAASPRNTLRHACLVIMEWWLVYNGESIVLDHYLSRNSCR